MIEQIKVLLARVSRGEAGRAKQQFGSLLLILILITTSSMVFAERPTAPAKNAQPDLEREQRLAAEIEDVILDGEPIYLNANGHKFLAIDTEAEGDTKGAVLLLHNRGQHPNWVDAIYPLRTGLPAEGWRTLAVQMPVLEKEATYYDYVPLFPASFPRIEAAIAYLKAQGIEKIVLAAHSCGVHMSMTWIAQKGDTDLAAYIGMGMGATDYKQYLVAPFPLEKMTVPVLDIYGENEYNGVLNLAAERQPILAAHAHGKSSQIVLPEANHYFTDAGEPLLEAVSQWLTTLE